MSKRKDLKAAENFHKTLPLLEFGLEAKFTLDAVVARVNSLTAAYNAHLANDTAHNSADTTNNLEATPLVNEMDLGNLK